MKNINIKKALVKMYDEGEFDRMLNYERNIFEKKKIKSDMKLAEEVKEIGAERTSLILMITAIKSVYTLKSLLLYALMSENLNGAGVMSNE